VTAFDFRPQFVALIENGTKISTIRKTKRGAVGRKMQLYTGQRTAKCRLIKEVTCTAIYEFAINDHGLISCRHPNAGCLWRQEGFESPSAMLDFFQDHYGFPFYGYLHEWSNEK
jgi:hypothetical protein